MNIERSRPPGPDPAHKKNRAEPNTEEFEKYKKVEKVREVDPEEQRKRQRYRPQEENLEQTRKNLVSPYEAYSPQRRRAQALPPSGDDFVNNDTRVRYNLKNPPPIESREDLPRSPRFWSKNPEPRQKNSPKEGSEEGDERGSSESKKLGAKQSEGGQEKNKEGGLAQGAKGSSGKEGKAKGKQGDLVFLEEEEQKKSSKKEQADASSAFKKPKSSGEFIVRNEDLVDPKEQKKNQMTSKELSSTDLHKPQKKGKEPSEKEALHHSIPSPASIREEGKDLHDHKKKDSSDTAMDLSQMQNAFPQVFATAAQMANPLTSYMSPEVAQLFSQMVGTIMVMVREGITTTEISLTSAKFASSAFYGAKIALDKFSSAPDAFNIRITGSEKAINLCNANIDELLAAFQNGNFRFKIHRFDTSLDTHGGTFKRKPKAGGDAGGSMGQGK